MKLQNNSDQILMSTKDRIANVWDLHFPLALSSTDLVDVISYETFYEFYTNNSKEGHNEKNQFVSEPFKEKTYYYLTRGDFFGFFRDGQLYGAFAGNTIDWSTYYFRSVLIKSEYREGGFYQKFLTYFSDVLLEIGCRRIEAHIAPFNHPSIHVLNKMGFMITGSQLSDRWGNLIHFTYFLEENSRDVFINTFCRI